MANPLQSLSYLHKTARARGWFRDTTLVYHGLGPLGADMFRHFMPVSAIIALYYGEEVRRHIETEWGTRVFSYEEMNGVRLNDSSDYHANFLRDHGAEIAAEVNARGRNVCLAPFAPSGVIHEFMYRHGKGWRLLMNPKLVQDFFEHKARLAHDAPAIGIPMPPAITVLPFGELDYRALSDKYGDGFVLQTPLSQAGRGTEFVFTEDDFQRVVEGKRAILGEEFAALPVKITPFLSGPSPNCTGCVVNGAVALSQPDLQVVGDPYFVNTPGQYIGSDFTVAAFTDEHRTLMHDVVRRVGEWLGAQGYRGNFGVDFLSTVDRENRIRDIFVSEVNARMVGESQYLADFQSMKDSVPLTFFHLAEWLGIRDIAARDIEKYNRSLPPLEGSALLLYSRQKGIFRAEGGITSGIYRMEEGKPLRLRDGYLLSHTEGPGEFVISVGVPWEGLVLGHPRFGDYNVHLCYILTRESIVNPGNYRLVSDKWRGIADAVDRAFKLTPCEPRLLLKEMPPEA